MKPTLADSFLATSRCTDRIYNENLGISPEFIDNAKDLEAEAADLMFRQFFAGHVNARFKHAFMDQFTVIDRDFFKQDAYFNTIHIAEPVKYKGFTLRNETYLKGDVFDLDCPTITHGLYVSNLGLYKEDVDAVSLIDGDTVLASNGPTEMSTMRDGIERAAGSVLVLGLGIGYFPFMALEKPNVKHVTVVEKDRRIIKLFEENILPQFPRKDDITIVCEDPFKYLDSLKDGAFDFCYVDFWHGPHDGCSQLNNFPKYENGFKHISFCYWLWETIWKTNFGMALVNEDWDAAARMVGYMAPQGWITEEDIR